MDAETISQLPDLFEALQDLDEPQFRSVDSGGLVAWSSGRGDGMYPTWIGHDTDGDVACFVADMLLFSPDNE